MKKWDDQSRLKYLNYMISNAKPLVQNGQQRATLKKISRETDFSSHASCRSDQNDLKETQLYKQLCDFQLQQYANPLNQMGYSMGLQKLACKNVEYQDSILSELKLLPGHKKKFTDLFKYLSEHIHEFHPSGNKGLFTPDNQTALKRIAKAQGSYGRFSNTRELYHDILRPVNRRNSQKHFSPYREGSVQSRPRVLPKLQKKSGTTNTKMSIESRVPNDEYINTQILSYKQDTIQKSQVSASKSSKKTSESTITKAETKPLGKVKSKTNFQSDILLVNQNGLRPPRVAREQKPHFEQSRLLKHLYKINGEDDTQMNLQFDQFKLSYQSFDNGTLSSTLINLDLEEVCHCLASLIERQITLVDCDEEELEENQFQDQEYEQAEHQQNELVDGYEQNEFNAIEEATVEGSKPDDLKEELFQRALQENESDQNENLDLENDPDDGAYGNRTDQDQGGPQEEELESRQFQMTKSYFSMESTFLVSDQKQFEQVFSDRQLENTLPKADGITSYCKNIMITTKMEREVAIICHIYVKRLLENKDLKITTRNWQRILFTALVIASKIWDDESFENNNFAKVLPQFTTIQINEMEKIFLKLINYNLYIKQRDYAYSYFTLRSFADKKKRSFKLKQLDLKTVLFLQKKPEQVLNKQQFLAPINKSF